MNASTVGAIINDCHYIGRSYQFYHAFQKLQIVGAHLAMIHGKCGISINVRRKGSFWMQTETLPFALASCQLVNISYNGVMS